MRIFKGSLPPSVFCPTSKNADDVVGQVKVKRKCGRPRNPIPRHKRESHINAEHRRRGKIQDGFRTLKNIVPKFEQTSGRDSKADILFKAVDYCRLLQNDIKELSSSMETVRAERDVLSLDIKNYKTLVPDLTKFDELTLSMDDRYTEYVQEKAKENWAFSTFKVILSPLFESYKLSVRSDSMEAFLRSVTDWAAKALSLSNLKAVCSTILRDDPTDVSGATCSYKNGQILEVSNMRSASSAVDPWMSASISNNNHCLSGQTWTSEHFSCRESASSGSSNSGTGTALTQMYGNALQSSQLTSSTSSTGSSSVNMRYHQDLPLNTGNLYNNNNGSGVFSDLYYNIDHDLHHHLNLARADITGTDPWSNHCFRQQQWCYYQNHYYPSPNHFQDFKKVHTLWGSQHQQLSQNMADELSPEAAFYCHKSHLLADRDVRYDLASPREESEAVTYLGHPTNFLDYEHTRHKRPSQSSSESDASLLNMETFAKRATETLGEQEKYAQLSPSTDSCISPGSSLLVPSPGLLNGRHADYTSCLEHLKQYKPAIQDNLDSQLTLALPSYKNTFVARKAENLTRLDEEIRPQWSSKNSPGPGSRQPSSERHEPSTRLAELLGQQSSLLQTWALQHTRDNMEPSSPRSNNITSSNTLPVRPTPINKVTGHLTNGFPVSVKQENDFKLPPFQTRASMENTHSDTAQLSSTSPKDRQDPPSNFQSDTLQGQCLTAQTFLQEANPGISNSSWLQPKPTAQDSPTENNSTTAKLDQGDAAHDSTQHQICYFEMAHQQLLKNHSLSQRNMKVSELKVTNQSESLGHASPHTSRDDLLSSKAHPANNAQRPATSVLTDTTFFSGQSNHLRHPLQVHQSSKDTTIKQKLGRKSSFEDGYTDESSQTVSECKKVCQWQQFDRTSQDFLAKAKSETIRASDYMGKLCVPTFADTALHF